MTIKLLTEPHLEFLSFNGGCTGSSESTLVKMPHCWKSHTVDQLYYFCIFKIAEPWVGLWSVIVAFTGQPYNAFRYRMFKLSFMTGKS